jgi:hypothetical protein
MCDKPTIIVVGRQAGTANALTPVIRTLAEYEQKFNLAILGISHAYEAWRADGLDAMRVGSFEEAVAILDRICSPCFMLTGTSLAALEDARFWNWARQRSVPTLAFVDSWVNYWQRFSSDLVDSTRFDLVPERIAVIDEVAAVRMREAGCPPHLLLITGHPAFDDLPRSQGTVDHEWRDRMVPPTCNYLVLFVSEPHSQTYGLDTRCILGYTEQDSLALTLTALEHIGKDCKKKLCIAVKPHPGEEPTRLACVLEAQKMLEYVTGLIVNGPRHALVAASDIVVGMTSMLLYEASLMGRPVVSVQPNRLVGSDLTDCHAGIEVATNAEQCLVALRRALSTPTHKRVPSLNRTL